MTQLDERTRELLCNLDQPPPGAQERVLASLLAATGGGGGDGGGGDFGPPTPTGSGASLAYAAKLVGATLGLTAAGFALVVAASSPLRSTATRTRTRDAPTLAQPTAIADTRASESSPPPPHIPTPPDPAAAPEPRTDTHEQPMATPRRSPDPSTPAPASTLEAELALLDAARRAKPSQALAALEQHRERFAHGVLADEREVMRIESLCALDRASEARAIAQAFLDAHADSPLRSRIEASCAD